MKNAFMSFWSVVSRNQAVLARVLAAVLALLAINSLIQGNIVWAAVLAMLAVANYLGNGRKQE